MIRITSDFSLETIQTEENGMKLISVLKFKKHQIVSCDIVFKSEGEIKVFFRQKEVRKFVTSRRALEKSVGSSSQRRKTIEARNLNLHLKRQREREGY